MTSLNLIASVVDSVCGSLFPEYNTNRKDANEDTKKNKLLNLMMQNVYYESLYQWRYIVVEETMDKVW